MFPDNHEEDVALYMSSNGGKIFIPVKAIHDIETINVSGSVNAGGCIPIDFDRLSICRKKPVKSNNMLIINKEKKYVLFKYLGEEYKVECHEKDKFNWFVGFGLALSKRYGNSKLWKNAREYFRNQKTRKLDYKNYAQWCVYQFYGNDLSKVKELQNKVKEINEYGKVDL